MGFRAGYLLGVMEERRFEHHLDDAALAEGFTEGRDEGFYASQACDISPGSLPQPLYDALVAMEWTDRAPLPGRKIEEDTDLPQSTLSELRKTGLEKRELLYSIGIADAVERVVEREIGDVIEASQLSEPGLGG